MFNSETTTSFAPGAFASSSSGQQNTGWMATGALEYGGYVDTSGEYNPSEWEHGATTEDIFYGEELPLGIRWRLEDPDQVFSTPQQTAAQRAPRPGTGSVGELTPVGDSIVPMMLCVAVYAAVRMRLLNKLGQMFRTTKSNNQ